MKNTLQAKRGIKEPHDTSMLIMCECVPDSSCICSPAFPNYLSHVFWHASHAPPLPHFKCSYISQMRLTLVSYTCRICASYLSHMFLTCSKCSCVSYETSMIIYVCNVPHMVCILVCYHVCSHLYHIFSSTGHIKL